MNNDPYFQVKAVSNSTLGNLEKLLNGDDSPPPTAAYSFGTLVDAMITENHKVDYLNFRVDGDQYYHGDFQEAKKLTEAWYKDPLCRLLSRNSDFQISIIQELQVIYRGFKFAVPAKAKYDGIIKGQGSGWDLKTTSATSQDQFNKLCEHYNYDRQSAFYMDLALLDTFTLVGVSKKNYKIFKKVVRMDDPFYSQGKDKYSYLSFKYWELFL